MVVAHLSVVFELIMCLVTGDCFIPDREWNAD